MRRTDVLRVALLAAALLASSPTLFAKLVNITLEKLVSDSDFIAYGKSVHASASAESGGTLVVSFETTSILKGTALDGKRWVRLCNVPRDVESYDLQKVAGPYIVFAKSAGDCFRPVLGLRSVIQTDGDFALTGNITGEPERQALASFLNKVKSLISGSRGS
jgi:hypothetical protein